MRSAAQAFPALAVALSLLLLCAAAGPALAHAMPTHESPAAGKTLVRAPKSVRITFDEVLDTGRCELRVEDAQGRVVSRGPARVAPANPHLLEVALEPLGPGTYHVTWVAVSRDGHRTQGDYSFSVGE